MSSSASLGDGLYMGLIGIMPRKRFGRAVRVLTGWEGSTAVSSAAVRMFVRQFGINMDEAEHPIEAYPNVRALFTRRLKEGARPIDGRATSLVSPVDGVLSQWGAINGVEMTQVKGRTFSVDDLLGGPECGAPFHGGTYLTIYLSPRHYHRIHSPVAGDVVRMDHIPGQLWPVNGPSVRSVDQLFAVNERVTSYVRTPGGAEVAVIKVGAVGVGHISLAYSDRRSNLPDQTRAIEAVTPPWPVARGGELGVFELGSTVVVVLPPGLVELDPALAEGAELKMGQKIGTLKEVVNAA